MMRASPRVRALQRARAATRRRPTAVGRWRTRGGTIPGRRRGRPGAMIGCLPGWAGHSPRAQVCGEAVLGEPPSSVAGRRAFGGDGEPLGFQVGVGGRVPVSGVVHDVRLVLAAGVLGQQVRGGVPVRGIARGGGHILDEFRVGAGRQMRLIPVEPAVP
jgi:hypothetical protein